MNLATPDTKFVVGKFASRLRIPFDDCEIYNGRFWAITLADADPDPDLAAAAAATNTEGVVEAKAASAPRAATIANGLAGSRAVDGTSERQWVEGDVEDSEEEAEEERGGGEAKGQRGGRDGYY